MDSLAEGRTAVLGYRRWISRPTRRGAWKRAEGDVFAKILFQILTVSCALVGGEESPKQVAVGAQPIACQPKGLYGVGAAIAHAKFGVGVVLDVSSGSKLVDFAGDRRKLACGTR